jgi:excinuclease ABC subunit A
VAKLIVALNKLVDKGNTVIIIEHNLDIIKVADHLIDLGPEGGNRGGEIIAEGTPEQVARVAASYTGQFLKEHLGGNGRSPNRHTKSDNNTESVVPELTTERVTLT